MVQAELAFEEGADPPSSSMRRLLDRLTSVGEGHGRPRPSPVRRRPSTKPDVVGEGFMPRRSKAGPCSNDALFLIALMLLVPLSGCLGGGTTTRGHHRSVDTLSDEWMVHSVADSSELPACNSDTLGRLPR